MSISSFEGIVENGRIRLEPDVRLPENARVYVLVPGFRVTATAQLRSPRLAHPEQAADFAMEIAEEAMDAGV